jgi:hypothetical protein
MDCLFQRIQDEAGGGCGADFSTNDAPGVATGSGSSVVEAGLQNKADPLHATPPVRKQENRAVFCAHAERPAGDAR